MNRKQRAKIRKKRKRLAGKDLRTARERTSKFNLEMRDIEGQFLSPQKKKALEQISLFKMAVRNLKEKRKSCKLTQTELARISGVPQTTISRIERGSQNVSLGKIQQLSLAMGCIGEINLIELPEKALPIA
ncbi:helix-turn-helix transcriptional regulator [Candidatus Dojkabacteria bacterium]|nr:helix-turn-helix transcriptional regulator [Candidatus Dojkabacteria bacterium]